MLKTEGKTKLAICEQIVEDIMGGYRGKVTLPSGAVMTVDNLFTGTVSVMPAVPAWRHDNGEEILGAMADLHEQGHVLKQVKLIFNRLDAELARRNVVMMSELEAENV